MSSRRSLNCEIFSTRVSGIFNDMENAPHYGKWKKNQHKNTTILYDFCKK